MNIEKKIALNGSKNRVIKVGLFFCACIYWGTQAYAETRLLTRSNADANRCLELKFDGTIEDFDALASSIATNGTNIQNIFNTAASYRQFQASQRYFIPTILINYGGSFNYNPEIGVLAGDSNSSSINPSYISNEPTLLINWNFMNLSQQSLVSSREYAFKSAKYSTAAEMLLSVASGINSYISLIQSANLVRTSWMVLTSVKQQVTSITALRKAGQRSLIDEISMKQQYDTYMNSYLTNLSNVEANIQSINTLTSLPICKRPSNLREFEATYEQLALKPLEDNLESVSKILWNNPSYLALLQSEKSAFFQAKSLMRTYLPTFSISAYSSLVAEKGDILGLSSANQGQQISNAYTNYVMISGNWTLYDGGQNYAAAEASFSTAEGLNASAKQILQSVVQTYKYAIINDKILKKNISVAKSSIKDAIRVSGMVEIAYKAGFRTYLDLQTSAQNTFVAMSTKATIESNFAANYFQAQQVIAYPVLPKTSNIIGVFLRNRPDGEFINFIKQNKKSQ